MLNLMKYMKFIIKWDLINCFQQTSLLIIWDFPSIKLNRESLNKIIDSLKFRKTSLAIKMLFSVIYVKIILRN